MALSYGTEGIRQKDYHVYIGLASTSGLAAAITTYVSTPTQAHLNTITGLIDELGECRADSIDLGIADGDSIEGNVLGKIVMNKVGTFTAELINATPANIGELETLDGQSCTIVLLERDTHNVGTPPVAYKTAILMDGFNLSYSEKITGSDSIRSTINIEKSVPSASAFRHIADLDQSA